MPYICTNKNKQNTYNMKIYSLKNGNILRIENTSFWADVDGVKITFDIVHQQKNGNWQNRETETISLSYYNSVQDYIESNYETI